MLPARQRSWPGPGPCRTGRLLSYQRVDITNNFIAVLKYFIPSSRGRQIETLAIIRDIFVIVATDIIFGVWQLANSDALHFEEDLVLIEEIQYRPLRGQDETRLHDLSERAHRCDRCTQERHDRIVNPATK